MRDKVKVGQAVEVEDPECKVVDVMLPEEEKVSELHWLIEA